MAELIRFGQRSTHKSEDRTYLINGNTSDPDNMSVRTNFLHFGLGWERTSDFGVELKWPDVSSLIQSFARMKHPEALRLQKAVRLAAAAEEAGWSPNDLAKEN